MFFVLYLDRTIPFYQAPLVALSSLRPPFGMSLWQCGSGVEVGSCFGDRDLLFGVFPPPNRLGAMRRGLMVPAFALSLALSYDTVPSRAFLSDDFFFLPSEPVRDLSPSYQLYLAGI